jgi:alkylhydroperoxidase family enzyme
LVRKGLTETEATHAAGDLSDATELPPSQLAALRLADALTEHGTPEVSDELMTELRRHFDEGQILELAAALSLASGWQRMIEAFGIRPDHWSEAIPLPRRPGE